MIFHLKENHNYLNLNNHGYYPWFCFFNLKNPLLIQPNAILRRIYPRAIWNMGRAEKNIYLTFDDGPISGLTEWVLDQLKAVNVTATFFCVGDNILKNPTIFERIKAEGHAVANHTMHHTKGFKRTIGDYIREVEECKKLVGTNLFRPPYGQLRRGQYKALIERGYKVIMWDVISYDFEKISEVQCSQNTLKNTKSGSVVLFHDNVKAEKNMKYALPIFLNHFLENGFVFKTL
jgi:peptidoglycan-N-acetylglucosamine deacetylase